VGETSISGSELRVTRVGATVELGWHGALIRCPCGGVTGYTDGRVVLRVGRVISSKMMKTR